MSTSGRQIFVLRQETNLHRVRLSADLLKLLAWQSDEEFKCWGFFRFPGELICASESIRNEDGTHPFDEILKYQQLPELTNIQTLSVTPPGSVLTASYRLIEFPAAWTSAKRTQLDLQMGVEATKRLGWGPPSPRPIYACAWSRLLILFSEARFLELQTSELAHWEPQAIPTDD
jgi:hypothetical protein